MSKHPKLQIVLCPLPIILRCTNSQANSEGIAIRKENGLKTCNSKGRCERNRNTCNMMSIIKKKNVDFHFQSKKEQALSSQVIPATTKNPWTEHKQVEDSDRWEQECGLSRGTETSGIAQWWSLERPHCLSHLWAECCRRFQPAVSNRQRQNQPTKTAKQNKNP